MGDGIAFVDGHGVGDAIARVHDNARGAARGVEGEDGLNGDVEGGDVEGLEHDLGHLLPVALGVEGCLCGEDWVLLGGHAELVVEGVVPDFLHIVPVGDDAVLDGILEAEDAALGLGLVADVRVLLSHADHDALMARTADDRGEDGAGRVVAGKAGLAHARAVIDNQGENFVFHCYDGFGRLLTVEGRASGQGQRGEGELEGGEASAAKASVPSAAAV